MRPQQIMFMGLMFAAGTMISLTFGGAWLGSTEVGIVNSVTVFKQATVLGVWGVTVPNITFLTTGARALMSMDFAFFQGGWAFFQWILFMVFGVAMLFGLYTLALSPLQGLFGRR